MNDQQQVETLQDARCLVNSHGERPAYWLSRAQRAGQAPDPQAQARAAFYRLCAQEADRLCAPAVTPAVAACFRRLIPFIATSYPSAAVAKAVRRQVSDRDAQRTNG